MLRIFYFTDVDMKKKNWKTPVATLLLKMCIQWWLLYLIKIEGKYEVVTQKFENSSPTALIRCEKLTCEQMLITLIKTLLKRTFLREPAYAWSV